MPITKSKVTSKAQTTVPKTVRDALGIQPGDELEWRRTNAGFSVRKARDASRIERWVGYLKGVIDEDVDELIEQMRGR